MIAAAFGLLFAGAGVGLHLDQYGGLQLEDATEVVDAIARAIEHETGTKPVLDDPLAPACTSDDRCLAAIRDRTKADDVVFVVVFGAPTKLRLIAERAASARSGGEKKIELDVPRDRSAWTSPLERVAHQLFPEGKTLPAQPPIALEATPKPSGGLRTTPIIAFAGGGVALATGIAFGIVSHNARTEIETTELSDSDYDSTLHRMRATGLVADILFGVAAACVIAGVVLLMSGDEH
jgi:hypothetical protein